MKSLDTWTQLNTGQTDVEEESSSPGEKDTDDKVEQDMHSRARQNGHYSASKKPL